MNSFGFPVQNSCNRRGKIAFTTGMVGTYGEKKQGKAKCNCTCLQKEGGLHGRANESALSCIKKESFEWLRVASNISHLRTLVARPIVRGAHFGAYRAAFSINCRILILPHTGQNHRLFSLPILCNSNESVRDLILLTIYALFELDLCQVSDV